MRSIQNPFPGWIAPQGFDIYRLGKCGTCWDRVSFARNDDGYIVLFERNGRDHRLICPGVPRVGVGRKNKRTSGRGSGARKYLFNQEVK